MGRRVRIGSAEQRRKHALQSGDEMVGLPAAFGQFLDLASLAPDLLAQEIVLALETLDIA